MCESTQAAKRSRERDGESLCSSVVGTEKVWMMIKVDIHNK